MKREPCCQARLSMRAQGCAKVLRRVADNQTAGTIKVIPGINMALGKGQGSGALTFWPA